MSRADHPQKRFAVDIMLGKLAKWLRALGFDARSVPIRDEIQAVSLISVGLIPVTRREKLKDIEGLVFIRHDHQFEQLKELVTVLGIGVEELRPFTRCSVCNAELLRIRRESAAGSVPDYILETATDFRKCPECSRVYWPGSHRERMIGKLKAELGFDLGQGEEDENA